MIRMTSDLRLFVAKESPESALLLIIPRQVQRHQQVTPTDESAVELIDSHEAVLVLTL